MSTKHNIRINKVNRPKERGNKLPTDIGWPEIYAYYLSRVTENIPEYLIPQAKARKAIGDINEEIMKSMILKNEEFVPPARMGSFRITKRKLKLKLNDDGSVCTTKLPVNWKATKELWAKSPTAKENKKLVFETNEHFRTYKCWFYWSKAKSNTPNKAYYQFVACRSNKRMLAYAIKNIPGVDYFDY